MKSCARLRAVALQLLCLLAAVGFSVGCAGKRKQYSAPTYNPPPQRFDAELKPLLDSYITDAAEAGVPVDPAFVKELRQVVWVKEIAAGSVLNNATLGKCRRFNENHPDRTRRYRVIEVTKPDARMMAGPIKVDDTTLKVVLYHELGHCLHDFKGHRADTEDSIMSTKLPKTRYQRLDALVQEHFDLLRNGSY